MSRYYIDVLVILSFTFIRSISVQAQEVNILYESILIDALEKGSSMIIADILSNEESGERLSEIKVKVVQSIILGDLTKEDLEDTINLSANVLDSKNLKVGSRYALFIIKECPYEFSWVHRNDFQLIDKSDIRTVQKLVSTAKGAYVKTSLSSFRKELNSVKDVDLSLIPDEIISLCEQFKTDPENRSVIAKKIYLSDIGSRIELQSESSERVYNTPKISLSRNQIISLLGQPKIKCGWTYSWLCGQSVERGWVGRDVFVLSVTFDGDQKVQRMIYGQQKKDKWTKIERAVNTLYELPGQPENILLGFQKALQRRDWQNVLYFCSENIHKKAQEYKSLEKFLNDYLPIKDLEKMSQFPTTGYSSRSDKIVKINLDLSLSVYDPKIYESLSWKWSLVKDKDKWLVDFKTIPLEMIIQKELFRRKLRYEDYETRRAKVEKGIKYNLIPLVEEFVIGKPLSFRIEMKNISDVPILYMTIGPLMINDPMDIIGPNGEKVRYIDMDSQTFAGEDVILSGETIVLVENYDATSQYYIITPGRYSFQFRNSNVISVEVKPGEISALDDIYTRLNNILPQGWTITRRLTSSSEPYLFVDESNAYIIVHMIGKRRGLQIDVDIMLAIVNDSLSINSNILSEYKFWGKCKWGNVYCKARDAETLWSDFREQIKKAIEIE